MVEHNKFYWASIGSYDRGFYIVALQTTPSWRDRFLIIELSSVADHWVPSLVFTQCTQNVHPCVSSGLFSPSLHSSSASLFSPSAQEHTLLISSSRTAGSWLCYLNYCSNSQLGQFLSKETSGNVCRHRWLSQLRVILSSSGFRPGMLLNIPEWTGQPLSLTKNYIGSNIASAEIQKP